MSGSQGTKSRESTLQTGVAEQVYPGAGAGIDSVFNNFVNGEDIIDLSRQYPGITSFDQLRIAATDDGLGVVIDLTDYGGGLLTLNGIAIDDLDAGDFVFYVPPPDLEFVGTDADQGFIGGAGNDTFISGAGDEEMTGGTGRNVFAFDPGNGDDRITDFNSGFDKIDLSAFSGISQFSDLTITAYEPDHTSWRPGGVVIDLAAFGGGTIRLDNVQEHEVEEMFDDMFILHTPTFKGTDEAETLSGDRGANTIEGLGGDDTLAGGAGNDAFVFASGHGNDTITDFIGGEDLIDLSSFANIAGLQDITIEDVDDGNGSTNARITLTDENGNETTVTVQGVSSSDLDADDFVFHEADGETLNGGEDSSDWLFGGEGNDTLYGHGWGDTLVGGKGDDTIYGGSGGDHIVGGEGDDRLTGGSEADVFVFGSGHGNDTITDFTAIDYIDLQMFGTITRFDQLTIRQSGSDTVVDLSEHGGGTLTLENFNADDLHSYRFVLNDIGRINSSAGNDTIIGSTGRDKFVFYPGSGEDKITNFTDGEDRIDLTRFTGITEFSDLNVTQEGDNVEIDLSDQHAGGKIILQNFDLDDLDATDFFFYETPSEGG